MVGVGLVENAEDNTRQIAQAWTKVYDNLRYVAGTRVFEQWLKPMSLHPASTIEQVRLVLPSPFMAQWVKNHFTDKLLLEFQARLPEVRAVLVEARQLAEERVLGARSPDAPVIARPLLDPNFTFERFVVDPANCVAFNAARQLAESGTPRFSPLYLHGATGLGKTHLMHAIGHAFLAAHPQAAVIYMPAERFMYEFVQALRAKETLQFKARMRSVDLLLIDDLQFIVGGKGSTQEEFYHTINELMNSGKRIVLASDCPPGALDGFAPRLAQRLSAGLAVDIRAPGLELRRTVLTRKLAETPEVEVPVKVIELLAKRITGSVRELEGALNRLVAHALLGGAPVTMSFAEATLGETLGASPEPRVTIAAIQQAVCERFGMKPAELTSARRTTAIARPRQIAMYLAKQLTSRSLPEIGRQFDRDHSTVHHAVKRIEALRHKDSEVDGVVLALMQQFAG